MYNIGDRSAKRNKKPYKNPSSILEENLRKLNTLASSCIKEDIADKVTIELKLNNIFSAESSWGLFPLLNIFIKELSSSHIFNIIHFPPTKIYIIFSYYTQKLYEVIIYLILPRSMKSIALATATVPTVSWGRGAKYILQILVCLPIAVYISATSTCKYIYIILAICDE